jgi:hypothetical protein
VHARGADPAYTVKEDVLLVFSDRFGDFPGGSATWTHDEPVPLLPIDDRIAFSARAGERTVPLYVDTAAELNFILWDSLFELGIPERLPRPMAFAEARVEGATGSAETRYFVLEALELGPHRLQRQAFHLIPMRRRDGGAPVGALGSLAFDGVTLDVDLAARTLRVNPSSRPESASPWADDGPLPRVRGTVGGVDVLVQIDTGAAVTIVSPVLRERLGLAERATGDLLVGASGEAVPYTLADLPPLDVAGASLPALSAQVHTIPTLAAAVPDGAWVNLGMDALAGRRLVVDYAARTVAIAPGSEAAGESL